MAGGPVPRPAGGTAPAAAAVAVRPEPEGSPDAPWLLFVAVVGPSGEPAGCSGLRFLDEEDRVLAEGSTFENGLGCLEVRGSGRLGVQAHDGGLVPRVLDEVLTPPPGGERRVEVRLEPGLAIERSHLDADGRPCDTGVVVAFPLAVDEHPVPRPNLAWRAWVTSRASGRFRIAGLPPGLCRIESERVVPVETEAGDRGIVLRKEPTRLVWLRLVDGESGEPVRTPTQVVRLDGRPRLLSYRAGAEQGVLLRPGETGRLRISAERYEDRETEILATAGEGRQETLVPLRPDPGAMAHIALEVLDPDGKPLERFQVCRPMPGTDGTPNRGAWLGDDVVAPGGAVEYDVTPGEHLFWVRTSDPHPLFIGSDAKIAVVVDRGDSVRRRIQLPAGGALRIRCTDGYRRGIVLRRADGSPIHHAGAVPASPGERLFAGVEPGPAVLEMRLPDGRPVRRPVDIRAGEIAEVEMDLPSDPPREVGEDGWAR